MFNSCKSIVSTRYILYHGNCFSFSLMYSCLHSISILFFLFLYLNLLNVCDICFFYVKHYECHVCINKVLLTDLDLIPPVPE